ncbi:kielin/chordin-like protein [Dreissena polymorpha]|uniref:Uncharacterized protein n=1 Tax=Dreissena polymorpha TaxID=45954 RepID=A0A9D4DGS4_DREPO|nr:kielin/chordin-like protein [Dreissena polymorpha]KAH3748653.1 hypothetical protein DPMN_183100 [Dreissena polymorpha]
MVGKIIIVINAVIFFSNCEEIEHRAHLLRVLRSTVSSDSTGHAHGHSCDHTNGGSHSNCLPDVTSTTACVPCVENQETHCYPIPCDIRCVDSVSLPGYCCPHCYNGHNCRYMGAIIPEGTNLTLPDGGVVICHAGGVGDNANMTFLPPPPTTTVCSNPCTFEGAVFCVPVPCMVKCVDGVKLPGNCCHSCFNGNNCMHNGHIIPEGRNITIPGGDVAYCETGGNLGGTVKVYQLVG